MVCPRGWKVQSDYRLWMCVTSNEVSVQMQGFRMSASCAHLLYTLAPERMPPPPPPPSLEHPGFNLVQSTGAWLQHAPQNYNPRLPIKPHSVSTLQDRPFGSMPMCLVPRSRTNSVLHPAAQPEASSNQPPPQQIPKYVCSSSLETLRNSHTPIPHHFRRTPIGALWHPEMIW